MLYSSNKLCAHISTCTTSCYVQMILKRDSQLPQDEKCMWLMLHSRKHVHCCNRSPCRAAVQAAQAWGRQHTRRCLDAVCSAAAAGLGSPPWRSTPAARIIALHNCSGHITTMCVGGRLGTHVLQPTAHCGHIGCITLRRCLTGSRTPVLRRLLSSWDRRKPPTPPSLVSCRLLCDPVREAADAQHQSCVQQRQPNIMHLAHKSNKKQSHECDLICTCNHLKQARMCAIDCHPW